MRLTYAYLCAIETKAERHFEAAASAWVRGNNDGREFGPAFVAKMEKRCDSQRRKGEALLEPFGIDCDYPGLYPSFKVNGFNAYDVRGALNDAVRVTRRRGKS